MKYPCLLTKKINEISSAKYNPRKITDEAMGRLTKSLAEFGNIQPITWNVRTGNVVGGHQRLKVYKAMGKTEVDVWAVDLDEQKEKAANIALNKLSGEFDMPMLKDILEEIDTGDLDMEITGFGMDEIALMMEDAHPEVTEDEVPEVPVDAITKPGDLWLLGEHRVLCGDSTSEADVSRLMNGEKADMVFTDPPYGIGSTLIAAEQLGRKCYGMEISPNYCDVIVKRWENLTGKKATLAK
jgi:hypothetical protein